MIAEGAMAIGCNFFAGNPIPPAVGIYNSLTRELQQKGLVAMNAPDDESALAYCIGASQRGAKAMTVTSGTGWASMIDTFQYALMTETPVVISVVQHLGPSTGGPTRGGQGDIWLVEFASSGGYTIPIFTPSNLKESYELTIHAFNWAERLRMPVILLTDQEIANTGESFDYTKLSEIPRFDRQYFSGAGNYVTFEFVPDFGEIPEFSPIGGENKVTITGAIHNKEGKSLTNSRETMDVLQHLENKVEYFQSDLWMAETDLEPGGETLVISYGNTARAAEEGVRQARRSGKKVSSIKILSLFPVPYGPLQQAAAGVTRIVIPEENRNGQYAQLIRKYFTNQEIIQINKMGSPVSPAEIFTEIK